MKFTRKENGIIANINCKKGFILKLLNAQAGYIIRKIEGIYRKLIKKIDNNGKKRKNKSKLIDKFRIKNKCKSENVNTNDNNTIDNNTIDNITIDIKIREKIRDIRVILNRLGNRVTKKDKKKIKKTTL